MFVCVLVCCCFVYAHVEAAVFLCVHMCACARACQRRTAGSEALAPRTGRPQQEEEEEEEAPPRRTVCVIGLGTACVRYSDCVVSVFCMSVRVGL